MPRQSTKNSNTGFMASAYPAAQWRQWAAFPLRMIVGYGFFAHGLAKMEKGPDKFVAIVDALGVPFPHIMAWAAIVVELVGGLLMLAGAAVPLISVPIAAVLLVALFTVHLPFGFTSIKLQAITPAGPVFGPPGIEADLLYLVALVAIWLAGPDPLSVDAVRNSRAGIGAKRRH